MQHWVFWWIIFSWQPKQTKFRFIFNNKNVSYKCFDPYLANLFSQAKWVFVFSKSIQIKFKCFYAAQPIRILIFQFPKTLFCIQFVDFISVCSKQHPSISKMIDTASTCYISNSSNVFFKNQNINIQNATFALRQRSIVYFEQIVFHCSQNQQN